MWCAGSRGPGERFQSHLQMRALGHPDLAARGRELVRCKFCWAAVFLIFAIQGLVELGGGHDRLRWWFETFGLSRAGVFGEGSWKPWKLFTYGWLHGGWVHAGLNALFLLLLGARLESILGPRTVAATLTCGIAGGGIAHIALEPVNPGGGLLLVGISGGCVALLLLQTTLSPESRMWPLPLSGRSLGWGVLLGELLLALINPGLGIPGLEEAGSFLEAQGFGDWFQIGHACHAGGGICGVLAGRWILRPRATIVRLQRDRLRREGKDP